jgi:hypothetical protein
VHHGRSAISVAAAVFLLCGTGRAAEDFVIHVHFINGKTGKPVPHKPIQVWDTRPQSPVMPGTVSARPSSWREKTDSDGVATFHLPGPPDYMVTIHLGMGGYWEECSRPPYAGPTFRMWEVVAHGVVNNRSCPPWAQKSEYHFKAVPGDVYFFAMHLTLWERIKHCDEWGCNK